MSGYGMRNELWMLLAVFLLQCHKQATQDNINKIQFNYTSVDDTGYRHESASVDYEFCIPAKNSFAKKVGHIEPFVQILKRSKGRSACSDEQWLCIVANHDDGWKKKLFAIAALPFVERIRETFYE